MISMKRYASFSEMIRGAAPRPDAPALKFEKDGRVGSVSYSELSALIDEKREYVRSLGKTSPGILCVPTPECVATIFAAVAEGLQVTLLGDNATREQVLSADVDVLIGDDEWREELEGALTRGVTDGGKILFFTSGTTSATKAVVLTEAGLCSSAYNGASLLPLSPDDTLMCMLPLDHVFGFVCSLLWALSCGASVALGRGARHYADDLEFFKPTALSAVPLLAGFLIKNRLLPTSLRLVLIGAGDCPPTIPEALKSLGIRVSFGYGLTETSSGVALSLGDDPYAMTVCPDFTVTLADDGEILIENDTCMMRGYYKDDEKTAAVLEDGVLHTGDVGAFDGGLLRVTGRKKEILVFPDGTKIFLPEYEAKIAPALAGYDFAVTGGDSPVLVVRGTEDSRAGIESALDGAMRDMPIGRRISKIIFVNEPLPRTATGKIKRWELQRKVSKI